MRSIYIFKHHDTEEEEIVELDSNSTCQEMRDIMARDMLADKKDPALPDDWDLHYVLCADAT